MAIFLLVLVLSQNTPAQDPEKPKAKDQAKEQEVIVTGRSENLVGEAQSATQGTIGQDQLKERPILRNGEILETVPGVVVT